jgi:hypothetical protein
MWGICKKSFIGEVIADKWIVFHGNKMRKSHESIWDKFAVVLNNGKSEF